MKKIAFSLLILIFSIAPNLWAQQKEEIKIGDVFTLYEIPYLNDHSIIYNPDEKKWHLFGIEYPQTQFIHLTADSLTQRGWIKQKPFTAGGAEIWAPLFWH